MKGATFYPVTKNLGVSHRSTLVYTFLSFVVWYREIFLREMEYGREGGVIGRYAATDVVRCTALTPAVRQNKRRYESLRNNAAMTGFRVQLDIL